MALAVPAGGARRVAWPVAPPMHALIIEDDAAIAEFIARGLREAGWAADIALNGNDGLDAALTQSPDVAIVDVMLPGRDGLALIDELRRQGRTTPVLILSARRSVDDRVRGLQAGGDDYLTKPFAFEELLARIRALLRRRATEPVDILALGDLALDRTARRVKRGGRELDLTPKEFALLEHFLLHPGATLTRSEIAEHVWDERYEARSNVIDVMVARLRRKLEAGGARRILHAVPGMGYVLRSGERGEPVGPGA